MIVRIFMRLRALLACPDCAAPYPGSNPHCSMCADYRNGRG